MEALEWEEDHPKRESDTGGPKVGMRNVICPNPLEGSYPAGPDSLSPDPPSTELPSPRHATPSSLRSLACQGLSVLIHW